MNVLSDTAFQQGVGRLKTWGDIARSSLLRAWRRDLAERKSLAPMISWYAYDSLEAFAALSELGICSGFSDFLGSGPVLDLGCGDGDIAFFLEHLGYSVMAVDSARTNQNGMRGVHALAEILSSHVSIRDLDIDRLTADDIGHYHLTVMLGVLYHLVNPLGVLRVLARRSRYCLLSTRIAARTPDHSANIDAQALVYLAGEREINNDPTNYWIFTAASLQRLFDRSGWELLDSIRRGCQLKSDPVSPSRDERMFCLLRSRLADPWYRVLAKDGVYPPEEGGWSWTARRFEFTVENAITARQTSGASHGGPSDLAFEFEFTVPEATWPQLGSRTMAVSWSGAHIATLSIDRPGRQILRASLPGDRAEPLHLEFELDKALPPTARDQRELGVIVGEVDGDFNLRIVSNEW